MANSNNTIQVTPVILCGGSGTRLWPLSRSGFPKQFLCLNGQESLFQQAAKRLEDLGNKLVDVQPTVIVTGEEHRFLAVEQLREHGVSLGSALLEPECRNTAPALTLAALSMLSNGMDPVMVVTPADQTITNAMSFQVTMRAAIADANGGHIVVLGITPDKPVTGFGYIQAVSNKLEQESAEIKCLDVLKFVEKPDVKTAEKYLSEGNYFWNSGMFVLKASVWLDILKNLRPEMFKTCQEAWAARSQDGLFIRPNKDLFSKVTAESVDYAVMENCPGTKQSIHMLQLEAGWNDLGAWDAVWRVQPKDNEGNAITGDVLGTNSHNSLVHASSRLVALVGVSDLVVIETPDAVLVADRSCSQDVKAIVNILASQHRDEHTLHRKVQRPWGWYDNIEEAERFKVKRIKVKPQASISLQKHNHRAEHWIVVSGIAEITIGKEVKTLTENQSAYIPVGVVHRLSNPGSIPLEIIEVQSGVYLGEDDIIRYEDQYGRIVEN